MLTCLLTALPPINTRFSFFEIRLILKLLNSLGSFLPYNKSNLYLYNNVPDLCLFLITNCLHCKYRLNIYFLFKTMTETPGRCMWGFFCNCISLVDESLWKLRKGGRDYDGKAAAKSASVYRYTLFFVNLTFCLLPLGHLSVSFSGWVMAKSVIIQVPRITS